MRRTEQKSSKQSKTIATMHKERDHRKEAIQKKNQKSKREQKTTDIESKQ